MSKTKAEKNKRRSFLYTKKLPILFLVIFGLMYMFFAYDLVLIQLSTIENYKVLEIFQKYSLYMGFVLALVSILGGYLIYFLLRKKLAIYKFFYLGLGILMTLPWYFESKNLLAANPYTDIAKGLSYYVGDPLLRTTKFMFGVFLFWGLGLLIKKYAQKKSLRLEALSVVLVAVFSLSGCVTINDWACQFFDNKDHCYQNAAVQDANSEICEKIKGEDFEGVGSNPPKDKCYKRIAENTGDLTACDKIEGGLYSYTKEECVKNTSIKHVLPGGCLSLDGADKEECIDRIKDLVMPGEVMIMDDKIKDLEEALKDSEDPDKQAELEKLKQDREDALEVMDDDYKKRYESSTDPMNKKISMEAFMGDIDNKTKDTLIALNNKLREKGQKMTDEEYKAYKDLLAFKNNPENDVSNMDSEELLKLRWNEKLGNFKEKFKFWKINPTPREKKLDEQLLFYQRMLERQKAIEKGLNKKQQEFERHKKTLTDKIKGDVYDAVMDEAKNQAFGVLNDLVESDAAGPTSMILGEALDVVQAEMKGAEFRGLVDVYDRGMAEELASNGGDVEKAHQSVVDKLQANPYAYAEGSSFSKYTNLLENKDCDGKNPHCINRHVFWKAMKKSYKYQNKLK